ncbi:MAG: hypothetical protein DWQ34_01790 [Planctomycetota bacterium]|nr:MAG: hypothetical protein DWQ29_20945 [Planctomycetota bacterium]REJ97543.1 MAG: hypothetical protein DWQ34_01790 [Planctomycetota bacterium]REK26930.1 MAG: hypothetical protein DWQ41_08820 [Planctomycetota bacterium]REK35419.1 MAG: hypothetical protein DWQ45_11935 [Planctomycetota bacterium]
MLNLGLARCAAQTGQQADDSENQRPTSYRHGITFTTHGQTAWLSLIREGSVEIAENERSTNSAAAHARVQATCATSARNQ